MSITVRQMREFLQKLPESFQDAEIDYVDFSNATHLYATQHKGYVQITESHIDEDDYRENDCND